MRGLITRPLHEARGTAQALAALGIEPVLAPLQAIVDLPPPPLAAFEGAQAILLTSANAARALQHMAPVKRLPVLAVGPASAQAARDAGFGDVGDAGGEGAALAALVRARLDPKAGTLVHVGGEEIAFDLAAALGGAGFAVERHVAYRAQAVDVLPAPAMAFMQDEGKDLALFFSPRAGSIFVNLVRAAGLAGRARSLTAAVLSRAVGDAVSGLDWRQILIAARPDQAALLQEIDAWKKGLVRQ